MSRFLGRGADQVARHWNRRTRRPGLAPTKWWQSRVIKRHINRMVSGEELEGTGEGWVHVLRRRLDGRKLGRAVSVGSGIGNKEMRFLRLGMVESFDLYELSDVRIEKGRRLAEELGLADRVRFRRADAFESVEEGSVELVHWNNSLHHMLDVRQAVEWSHRVLTPSGVFFLDDFVGPSRFQWSDRALQVTTGARALLPERYLLDPHAPENQPRQVSVRMTRPNPRKIAREDPSEAVDSESILPAVTDRFPGAEIRLTGGLVYHVALANILYNFDEDDPDDRALLELLLALDEACLRNPELESPYAVALAFKR